ncbi:hypothetical protein [Desulfoferula mesophila]|uniref:Uncharacterized protein n=1 Tax=Desulfoferula mesophila TaxID=3058419 RepID=A0AAU9EVX1_9BACT|nr:hypothetical protein FAK_09390 [Desulfoferula mesophilus]
MIPENMKQIIETTDDTRFLIDLAKMALSSCLNEYVDWGEEILKVALDKIKDARKLVRTGTEFAMSRNYEIRPYARNAYLLASGVAQDASDLVFLADSLAHPQIFGDVKWGGKVYHMAVNRAECAEEYLEIADSIAQYQNCFNFPRPSEVFRLAIESAMATDKMPVIIHWIFEKNGTNREEWALPVFEEAVGMTIDEAFMKYRIMIARY